jgi:hypothetical protein
MPGRLVFLTTADGSATPTERMRIDNAGNVGIGTSSPKSLIHINANTTTPSLAAVTGANISITGLNTTVNAIQMDSFAAENQIFGRRANGTLAALTGTVSTNYLARFSGRGYQTTTSLYTADTASIQFRAEETFTNAANGTSIRFSTTALTGTTVTERMIIDPSGNVQIGGTLAAAPVAALHVSGTGLFSTGTTMITTSSTLGNQAQAFQINSNAATAGMLISKFSADALGSRIFFAKSRSATIGTGSIVSSGDVLGQLVFLGYGSTSSNEAARISVEVDGTPGAVTDMPGRIVFLTSPDGTSTPVEAMRIDNAGQVGIGTTPATKFHVSGTIRYTSRPAAAAVTAIGVDANGDIKEATSSIRFKENVKDYKKGLSDILKLRPITFNYIYYTALNAGFIAEELYEQGFEEFVLKDLEDIPYSVPYGNIVALLTKGIQEQQATIESLTARLELLESKVV